MYRWNSDGTDSINYIAGYLSGFFIIIFKVYGDYI